MFPLAFNMLTFSLVSLDSVGLAHKQGRKVANLHSHCQGRSHRSFALGANSSDLQAIRGLDGAIIAQAVDSVYQLE